jgi:hypothetical protein
MAQVYCQFPMRVCQIAVPAGLARSLYSLASSGLAKRSCGGELASPAEIYCEFELELAVFKLPIDFKM